MPDQFGSAISRADADDMFARFVGIRQRSAAFIRENVSNPTDKRYYSGRSSMDPVCEDWAFVFSKNILEDLLSNMNSVDADCFFVFNGAKAASGSEEDGRPTVMLFPAKQFEVTNPTDVEFRIFGDLGFQHPGTGGGTLSSPVRLPDSFTKDQYHE